MNDNATPQRDTFVADQLNRLDVPPPGPDFWDTFSANLADADAGTGSAPNGSRPGPGDDLAARRRRRRRRSLINPGQARPWLAAAAALALVGGGLGYFATQNDDPAQSIDATGDGTGVATGDGNGADNGAPAEDPTGESTDGAATDGDNTVTGSTDVEADPDYDTVASVDLLGPVALLGTAPDGQHLLVSRDEADTVGCTGEGSLRSVEVMAFDGSIKPSGLTAGDYPGIWPGGADNRVVVTDSCEYDTRLRGIATLNPDGTVADMVEIDPQFRSTPIAGAPVWSPDGSGFTVTNLVDDVYTNVLYLNDGDPVSDRTVDGELLAILADGTPIERAGGEVQIYGGPTVFYGDDGAGAGAVIDPRGRGNVAVFANGGIVVLDGDGNELMGRRGFPVIDADIAANGDVAWISEPNDLFVYDISRDVIVDVEFDPSASTMFTLSWAEGGASLAVDGTSLDADRVTWLVHFAEASGESENPSDGPDPVDEPDPVIVDDPADDPAESPTPPVGAVPGTAYETPPDSSTREIRYVDADGNDMAVVDTYPEGGFDPQNQLRGTIELDGGVAVVYEHIDWTDGAGPAVGRSEIVIDDLDPATENRVIDQREMTGIDGTWFYTDSVTQLDTNLLRLGRSFHQGACYWFDHVDLDGNPVAYPDNPAPRPADLDALAARSEQSGLGGGICPTE